VGAGQKPFLAAVLADFTHLSKKSHQVAKALVFVTGKRCSAGSAHHPHDNLEVFAKTLFFFSYPTLPS